MKMQSILSETVRNILSGTTRAALFAILLGILTGGLAAADVITIVGIQNAAQRYLDSGAAIRTLTTAGEVDGEVCERLPETGGIQRSGAVRETAPTDLPALPRSPIVTYEASPTFAGVLGVPPATSGIWISESLANSLGVSAGEQIETSTGTAVVAAVYAYPEDGRDARLNLAIVIPTPAADTFDECWALIWPEIPAFDSVLRSATVPGAGETEPITIAQLNKTRGAQFDGLASFTGRITQWVPVVSVLLGAGLGWLTVMRRRLEHASALHAGQTRAAFTSTVLAETAVWATASVFIGLEIVALTLGMSTDRIDFTFYSELVRTVVAGAAAALLTAAVATIFVRENLLFRFFKERG